MPVPDYQSFLLPVVQAVGDGAIHTNTEIREAAAQILHLSEADLKELLPSEMQTAFENRVGWAMTYLTKAGLLQRPKRAHYQITDRGREALSKTPTSLTTKYLRQFPEFVEFMSKTHPGTSVATGGVGLVVSEQSPVDLIEAGYQTLRAELAEQIIEQVMACSPAFFERLVVDLLVAMGYGGSRADAGRAVGKSGDGGIDGIIKEDRLGLDAVYIQAKRWEGSVGSDRVMAFSGALDDHGANKGVLITTSHFTADAKAFAEKIQKRIVLIDGVRLAELMMDFGVGVTEEASYSIKRLDADYFEVTE